MVTTRKFLDFFFTSRDVKNVISCMQIMDCFGSDYVERNFNECQDIVKKEFHDFILINNYTRPGEKCCASSEATVREIFEYCGMEIKKGFVFDESGKKIDIDKPLWDTDLFYEDENCDYIPRYKGEILLQNIWIQKGGE